MPVLSLGLALLLTLFCLLLLPQFLHHAARSVDANTIITNIGRECIRELESLNLAGEQELSDTLPGPDEEPTVLAATETGYVQLVDPRRLLAALPREVHTVRLDVRTGDFLFPGLPLLSLWPEVTLSERQKARLHAAFAVGRTRTTQQDVLYGVRLLVDMALKALSPAINDVTTSVLVVNELGAVGRAVAARGWLGQGWWRRHYRGVTLLRPGFGLGPFLQDAFGEIPLAATNQPRVLLRILEVLAQIASVVPEATMRMMLVQTGRAVYEAARLSEQRDRDVRLIQERWSQLQKEATQPGALPCETVH
jgi:uncharacterized membrane protein